MKIPQRRDNAGAVCNSGMGMLFLCIYVFYIIFCKIQNGRQGARKWLTGSGKGFNPRLLGIICLFELGHANGFNGDIA